MTDPHQGDGDRTVGWSLDGTTFRCRGPLRDALPLGGYVRLAVPGGAVRLGQVLEQTVVVEPGGRRVAAGGNLVDRAADSLPFDDAVVTRATADEVRPALARPRDPLEVGTIRGHDDIPAMLAASGFNRHTFLCGQSGSGKTYSLGVLLERLVLHTSLPLLVIDPNGDHVHLGRPADDLDADIAADYADAASGVQVLRPDPGPDQEALGIHLPELGRDGIGALMQLHPIADRHEFSELMNLIETAPERGWRTATAFANALEQAGGPVDDELRLRLANLGITDMATWAGLDGRGVVQRWRQDRPRALVADTSSFATRRERLTVTVALLAQLWEHRRDRRPMLLVVDEAHDVCPATPTTALEQLAVDQFVQIAGEGRKYGIHLLLSTQRPDKLPDNVLSQCDNLILMRVNSALDRAVLAERFSFAPAGLVDLAGTFGLGEALLAGRVAQPPVLATIGTRLTPEGGSDIPTDWASRTRADERAPVAGTHGDEG